MKRKLNKIGMLLMASLVFGTLLLVNMEKNENGKWGIATASARDPDGENDGESDGGDGTGETLYFKKPTTTEPPTGCPIVRIEGTRWVGVSGNVAVGSKVNGNTVTVNVQGEKGYYENYSYSTNGSGTKVTCPEWDLNRTCTPGLYCPGTGPDPYKPTE